MKKAVLALAVMIAIAGVARAGNDGDHDHGDHGKDGWDYYHRFEFQPGTLVLSRTVYVGNADTVTVGQTLPPGCVAGTVTLPEIGSSKTTSASVTCSTATNNGTYPGVFENVTPDPSFGVSSPIFLDNLTTDGWFLDTLPIPPSMIVTSFSSKSELAVNLSTDGKSITFGGYVGGPGFITGTNQLDASNSNTPGVIDPTNPVVSQYYRSVAEVDAHGHILVTDGNAYSGDNGRAVIKGDSIYYQVGNSNNGGLSKSQLTETQVGVNLTTSTGTELLIPGQAPPIPPNIAMIGDFEITQVIDPATGKNYTTADKAGKDNNFRGVTIYNNTLYVTKGSGSNGINTVYQVGTPRVLPTGDEAALHTVPITPLPGFPTTLASNTTGVYPEASLYPFGLWFADANTLYVCDEGDGILETPNASGNVAGPEALADGGVQKWHFNGTSWQLLYVLQNGLNIGAPYTIPGYPSPATDGCRNLTGSVNREGTVTIYAVTSTVSSAGDQGADPNKLVKVSDRLDATTLPEKGFGFGLGVFTTIRAAHFGELFRGVSFAPQDFGPFGFGFGGF